MQNSLTVSYRTHLRDCNTGVEVTAGYKMSGDSNICLGGGGREQDGAGERVPRGSWPAASPARVR